MGAYKALDIELQELDADVDFTNSEDVFDLVVDTHLCNKPLSRLMLIAIAYELVKPTHRWLMLNSEFVDCWDWHSANNGGK
jgi:hypothetical protein